MEHSLPSNLICGQGCSWDFDPAVITSRVLGLHAYIPNPGLWGVGDWAQCWCMRSVYSPSVASQPAAGSVTYRWHIASLHAISSVSYKAGWLSHRGLQVLQRSKPESDTLGLYGELWRRGTLLSMTHLGEEEFRFLWSTSGRWEWGESGRIACSWFSNCRVHNTVEH